MIEDSKSEFNPLVSIIIPVYNGSNYVKEAIASALVQSYKNIEVLVINDGSKDSTEEIALSYGNKIRYFSKENGGVATALNLGIAQAKGNYVSWLSHDDLYYPDKIEKQIKELSKLEDKNTILFSNWVAIDSSDKEITRTFFEGYKPKLLSNPLFCVLFGLINGCTLLIPKKCFGLHGVFNESLRTSQDYDLWYRIFPKFPIKFMANYFAKYRIHSGQGSQTMIEYDKESNDIWINMIQALTNNDIFSIEPNMLLFYRNARKFTKRSRFFKATNFITDSIGKLVGKKLAFFIISYDDFARICYKIFVRPILKIIIGRAAVKRKHDLNRNHRI